MSSQRPLRIVLVKPSKYSVDGSVERFRRGFMPNASLAHMKSLTPSRVRGRPVEVRTIDEYVEPDLSYLRSLAQGPRDDADTVVGIVGVQSHQLHRALDLAAYARQHGVRHV